MKYRLKAYESFILREGWLTKALLMLKDNPKLFQLNSGADDLGVGTNMAKAIRYWLRTAGLTEEKANKGVFLTELGNVIAEKDPYVEDLFSLFILHCNIATNYEQATSWGIFFNDIDITSFTRSELEALMTEYLVEYTGETNLPERSIKEDCSALLSMYCDTGAEQTDPEDKKLSPFAALGMISLNGNLYSKKSPQEEILDSTVILYVIYEELLKNGSLLIDDIVNKPLMAGRILNLNRVGVNYYLDELERAGYITVNRTAGLDIIYPDKTPENKNELVKKHFKD